MLKLLVLLNINMNVKISKYPLHSRSQIFRKTESPFDREFSALSEYSEFHKILIFSTRFHETTL